MSKSKKNIYAKKAKQKALAGLGSTSAHAPTKAKLAETFALTGRDIVIGGVGGALAGSIAGRGAFIVGAVFTGVAHYFGSATGSVFGVGMMASGGYQAIKSLNGVEKDGIEGVKERLKNFQENLKHQLFLDKLLKKKKTSEDATDGVGNVEYFRHGNQVGGLDFTEANRIEEQIRESARQFEARQMSGADDDMNGTDGVEGTDGFEGTDGVEGFEGVEERLL
ncbi:MAG: hypothetical protein K0S33_3731 [Bacteroidetes bacterium]|jgi:hypothetical protein|nr:hypothetical protein [Bacteroidota bacterium]